MKTTLHKLDKILVKIGRYPSKEDLIEDAFRALLRTKPELKIDIAIELYKKNEVSLSRASEICGLTREDFKELLKERGIKVLVPHIPAEEIDEEVKKIACSMAVYYIPMAGQPWIFIPETCGESIKTVRRGI